MATESNFERIEAYLDKRLSPKEAQAFHKELQQDPELRRALLEHRLAGRAIDLARTDAIRSRLESIREKAGVLPDPAARIRPLHLLAVAATVLVLVIAGGFLYSRLNFSNEALVDRYYQQATSSTVAGAAAGDELYEQGLLAFFRDKDYQQAIGLFAKVPLNSDYYLAAQYYLAHSEFRSADYSAATRHFAFLLEAGDLPVFIDRNEVIWNLLLTRLAADDNNALLQPLFEEIQRSPTASPQLKEKAQQLNKNLNSIWRKIALGNR